MIYLSLNFHKPRSTYSLVSTIKLKIILLFSTIIILPKVTLLNTKTYYHTMSGPGSKRR